MPTENRSSNTEMVSVPEGYMLVERSIWTEQQVEAATACITRLKGVHGMRDRDLAMAAIDAAQCKAPDIALADLLPAPQPQPEPIAWMVGTAIWWTKEEAERDAAAAGQPVIPFGALTGAVKQHQGEPVAWRGINELGEVVTDWIDGVPPSRMVDLCGNPASFASIEQAYTHVEPSEVERLIAANTAYARRHLEQQGEAEQLRIELAQCATMAAMVYAREWAEHVGSGPISSKVEAAITQLHNDIHEANEKLVERDVLLDRLRNHLIAKGVLGEFGPELFQILNIEAPERASLVKP